MSKKGSNPDPTFKKPPPPPPPPPRRIGVLWKVNPPHPWPNPPAVESEGDFLVPEIIRVHKKGILARIARTVNCSYGWEDFRLADEFEKALKENRNITSERRVKTDD